MTTKAPFLYRILLCLSALGLLLAGFAGCSSGSSGGLKTGPGVNTDLKYISLGVLTPLSGVVGQLIGVPLTNGIDTYYKHLNDNGGITVKNPDGTTDHYRINLVERDVPYPNTQAQVQFYNEIHNNVLMLAESLGTPTTFAIKDLSTQDHMLVQAATLAASLAHEKYLFFVGTPYRLQFENAIDYIVNKLGKTNAKVGLIYQNDDYGQDGQKGYQEGIAYYNAHGASLQDVGQEPIDPSSGPTTDFTSQISALKQAGAQYVFQATTIAVSATIVGQGYGLGFTPQWVFQSPAWSQVFLANKALLPLLQNFVWVCGQGALWGDTSVPGMAQMLQDVQKYIPNQAPDGFFEFGYAESYVTAAILQKAADNGDLTRDGLYNAFNSIGTVNLGGILPPANFGTSASGHIPSRDTSIYSIDPTIPTGSKNLSGDFTGAAAQVSVF